MRRQRTLLVATWLVAVCSIALVLRVRLGPAYKLATYAVQVQGQVTAKEPGNHRLIKYSFTLNGAEYSGQGPAGRGNADFDALQVGQGIAVFALSDEPATNTSIRPDILFRDECLFAGFVLLTFPLALVLSVLKVGRYVTRYLQEDNGGPSA